jgi:hypothetical protein
LPVIVLSQFAGTSLWFAGNAVLDQLVANWQLPNNALSTITAAVQFGFIAGTLVFAFFSIADRYSPRKVFLFSAVAGALINAAIILLPGQYWILLGCRFLTGFFLAGLYPVGMKIAAGWYKDDLGMAIGFLVGALVLGTGFPHLLVSLEVGWSWMSILVTLSIIALLGGILMYVTVPDGPYLVSSVPFNPSALKTIFQSAAFRASAFGYFGHMWELYAFWAFVPIFIGAHFSLNGGSGLVSAWSFAVIGSGFIGAAGGGLLVRRFTSAKVAAWQLSVSGICCVLSPLMFMAPTPLFLLFLLLWGITVIGDSPQFSTLNAVTAPREYVGSALTIANCIGFSVTIVSIYLVELIIDMFGTQFSLLILVLGPLFGLISMRPLLKIPG